MHYKAHIKYALSTYIKYALNTCIKYALNICIKVRIMNVYENVIHIRKNNGFAINAKSYCD